MNGERPTCPLAETTVHRRLRFHQFHFAASGGDTSFATAGVASATRTNGPGSDLIVQPALQPHYRGSMRVPANT